MPRNLEQRAAEKVLWQNVALGLPSVTTAGQYTDNIELPAQFFDINQDGVIDKLQFGTRYTSLGNLSVNQLVFDGSYIVAVLATSVLRDQAALNREKTEIEVRQQTAQFYHLNVILSENEKVLSENLKLAQSTATQMAAMAKEGLAELENVDQINLVKQDKLVKLKVEVAIKAIVLREDKVVVTKAIVHKAVAIKVIVLTMEHVQDKVEHAEEICHKRLSKKKSIRKQFKIRSRKHKRNYQAKVVAVKV